MTLPSITLPRFAASAESLGSRVRDVSLGLVAGIDLVLWNSTMTSLIFGGVLSGYLRTGSLVVFAGAALVTAIVTLGSAYDLHVTVVDEQAVAVLATIALTIDARRAEFASADAAAATMFAIMACVTIGVGVCLRLAVRFNATALLQLIPFPVICGFLAGLGWLLLNAGITMLDGHGLIVSIAGGAVIFAALHRSKHFLVLPGLLLSYCGLFYLSAALLGASPAELRGPWLFAAGGSAGAALGGLDFAGVNLGFMASVAPQMATIVALGVLGASINVSGLEVAARRELPLDRELRTLGSANIASGLVMGLPAVTEIVASTTYRKVGARSRLFPAVVALCALSAAIAGERLIELLPKVVMGSLVFFAAIQFLADWLFGASRRLSRGEAVVVWSIFATIALVGFMPGIVVGLGLASLLFVVRYSRVDVVASSFRLSERGSSVDRSPREQKVLLHHGRHVRVFNLRGYLFFGTASTLLDQLKRLCDASSGDTHFVFSFQYVTGIDSTVVQTFDRIAAFLDSRGIVPVLCGMTGPVCEAFGRSEDAAQLHRCRTLDAALKWTEETILASHGVATEERGLRAMLRDALGDDEKAARLAAAAEPRELAPGEYLFRQGDEDTSIYVIERGAIEIRLEREGGSSTVLREFRPGTVIGEMASYSDCRARSASAAAVQQSIVHRLDPDTIDALGEGGAACRPILHEFTARVLVARLQFMNGRLALEA